MKTLIILLALPLQLVSQDISGIWTGLIHTQGNDLSYELVISENKEKSSGYSCTIFMVNGIENVGIKSVIVKNKKGNISIEDDQLIYNNYTTPPKRLKLLQKDGKATICARKTPLGCRTAVRYSNTIIETHRL